ncbi:hypothetical protein PAPHI01_1800 [Pancytospora philotis]|nr:hypothetical protein PAPHI01_1800 [Pancytospora philotis]
MRCAISYTCVAQCLAASMLRQAGLLTADDYARVASAGFDLAAIDSSSRYKPDAFPRLAHEMCLAKPMRDDELLQTARGGGAGEATAHALYLEWVDQSLKLYQETLSAYVKQFYKEHSFDKRCEDAAAFASERTTELERFFSSPERLRKSYLCAKSLIRAYDFKYYEFYDIVKAISSKSRGILDIVRNPDRLDAGTIGKLNALRRELDRDGGAWHKLSKGFRSRIHECELDTAEAPKALDGKLVRSFEEYCDAALVYVSKFPERISREIILKRVFGMSKKDQNMDGAGQSARLHFVFLRFVYPEMSYKAWGSFWQRVQKQVADELKALQKHAEDVSNCMSSHRKIVLGLFEGIDTAIAKHSRARRSGYEFDTAKIDKIIADEIAVVARKMLDQTHGERFKEMICDEAAVPRESKEMEELN